MTGWFRGKALWPALALAVLVALGLEALRNAAEPAGVPAAAVRASEAAAPRVAVRAASLPDVASRAPAHALTPRTANGELAEAGAAPADANAAAASATPKWLREAVEVDPDDGPLRSDPAELELAASRFLDPRQLRVLQDLIDLNGLGEDSTRFDRDDGDGVLEPWELGTQLWQAGELIALTLGPDRLSTYGYGISELPPSIGDLASLQLLDLQQNALAELPPEIGELRALRELVAYRNQLRELPASLAWLPELRVISVGQNQIEGLPEVIGELRSLEWLLLEDNPLAALPEDLDHLERLAVLNISRNQSPAAGPHAVGGGLDQLPAGLAELPKLRDLYVSGNRLGCAGGAPALAAPGARIHGLAAQHCR